MGWMSFLLPNHQYQSTEGNKSTSRKQWLGLILSSSTTRLLTEWPLLPSCWLSDTSISCFVR